MSRITNIYCDICREQSNETSIVAVEMSPFATNMVRMLTQTKGELGPGSIEDICRTCMVKAEVKAAEALKNIYRDNTN